MKTVGELKAFLRDIPDDTPIVQYESNMERSGYFNRCFVDVAKMSLATKGAVDSFDGIHYTYEVYEKDDNGQSVVMLG